MNPDMLARLKEHARATVAAEVAAAKLRGLGAVRVEGRQVSLTQGGQVRRQEKEDTWRLVIWAEVVVNDSLLGVINALDFSTPASTFDRSTGTPDFDLIGAHAILENTVTGFPRTRTSTITVEVAGHSTLAPVYGEPGAFDPGPVIVKLEDRDVNGGTLIRTVELEVPAGGATQTYTAAVTDVVSYLQLVAARRKRD
jgi:hypothetical protein